MVCGSIGRVFGLLCSVTMAATAVAHADEASNDRVIADPAGHFKFLRVWSVKFLHPRGRTRDC
ncbi:hypothetical protein ACVIQT_001355 [Bradyrhizobium diazoefficiens]